MEGMFVVIDNLHTVPLKSGSSHKVLFSLLKLLINTPIHLTRTPQIWDRSTLQVLKVLKGHKNAVRCLQYDEKVVISGSYDHTIKLVHPLSLSTCCTSLTYRYTVSIHIDAELTACKEYNEGLTRNSGANGFKDIFAKFQVTLKQHIKDSIPLPPANMGRLNRLVTN